MFFPSDDEDYGENRKRWLRNIEKYFFHSDDEDDPYKEYEQPTQRHYPVEFEEEEEYGGMPAYKR